MKPQGLSPSELDLVAAARLTAIARAPYLASALTAITFIRQDGLGTLGVDRKLRVYIDPIVIERWTTPELAGVLLHEVNHVIRGHHDRQVACGIPHVVWNMGADLEINDDLWRAGLHLPDGALMPEMFGFPDGEIAETYASRILDDCIEVVEIHCGSGAGGEARAHELDVDEFAPGVSQVRLDGIRDAVARSVLAGRGEAPGGIERWASARVGLRTVWPAVLRNAVRRAVPYGGGHHRHTWTRPRRHNPTEALLPSLRAIPMHVVVIVDSSGSMDQDHLDQAASDIQILRSIASIGRLTVVACDVKAVEIEVARSAKQIAFVGGGGTSLSVGLDFAVNLRNRADLVVVITDGLTDWPEVAPHRLPPTVAVIPHGAPPVPDWMAAVNRTIGCDRTRLIRRSRAN